MDWLQTVIEFGVLLFTGVQILLLSRQINQATKWNRLNSTFLEIDKLSNYLENINPELVDQIGLLKADDSIVDTDVFKELMKDPKSSKELYTIMHFYESFSIAILSGYINANIAKRLYYVNVLRAYTKLKPYILLRSQITKTEMCQHFQKLYNKWTSEGLNLPIDNYEDRRR